MLRLPLVGRDSMVILPNVITFLERNQIDYEMIINCDLTRKRGFNKDDRDINVCIPIQNRAFFLEPCLRYLKAAALRSSLKINFIVIEHNLYPTHQFYCQQKNIDYFFLSYTLTMPNKGIAKSLCYNLGYLLSTKSEWMLFHDLDILVTEDFFETLEKHYLKNDTIWVQPYRAKRVNFLDVMSVMEIIEEKPLIRELCQIKQKKEARPGSTGGSILIKSEAFKQVGGYDPELFWGYAPEDNFLWMKLEHYGASDKLVNRLHCRSAVYADDPGLEVYHMDHPPADINRGQLETMEEIFEWFCRATNKEKSFFIAKKKASLEKAIQEILRA